jgi:hypothetical protein
LCLALACSAQVALAGPRSVQDLVEQCSATNHFNLVSNKL